MSTYNPEKKTTKSKPVLATQHVASPDESVRTEGKKARGVLVNIYSFSWLTDSVGLLEKKNVASNINENNASAIIPTMCQPLKIKFIPEATIPIMLAIFTFRFIILLWILLSTKK